MSGGRMSEVNKTPSGSWGTWVNLEVAGKVRGSVCERTKVVVWHAC